MFIATVSDLLKCSGVKYLNSCRCAGNLNLEGYSVDACVLNGTKCGQAAADAFCQYLGFDYNAAGLYSTVVAKAPALAMTGKAKHFAALFSNLKIYMCHHLVYA